jgi:hypothetical protein
VERRLAEVTSSRLWLATVAVIILFVAVWKFIDFRMQPPPPPKAPLTLEAKP